MFTKAELEDALEEATSLVWYIRSNPDEPVARAGRRRVEATYPRAVTSHKRDGWPTLGAWEGRMATLRWMLANDGEAWDAAGRFDS